MVKQPQLYQARVTAKRAKVKSKKLFNKLLVLLVGDTQCGKTQLLQRYMDDTFTESLDCTTSAASKDKIEYVDCAPITLQVWDIPGQDRFRKSTCYQGAQGIILLYDTTSMKSFNNLANWHEEVNNYAYGVPLMVLGCKSDSEDAPSFNRRSTKCGQKNCKALCRNKCQNWVQCE